MPPPEGESEKNIDIKKSCGGALKPIFFKTRLNRYKSHNYRNETEKDVGAIRLLVAI